MLYFFYRLNIDFVFFGKSKHHKRQYKKRVLLKAMPPYQNSHRRYRKKSAKEIAYTPLMIPNINKTAGATQHKIPAIAALMEYFKLHLIKIRFFFSRHNFIVLLYSKIVNMFLDVSSFYFNKP